MNLAAQKLRPTDAGNQAFLMRELSTQIRDLDDLILGLWKEYWAARGDKDVEELDKKTKGRVNSYSQRIHTVINKRQGLRVERIELGKHILKQMQEDKPCYL